MTFLIGDVDSSFFGHDTKEKPRIVPRSCIDHRVLNNRLFKMPLTRSQTTRNNRSHSSRLTTPLGSVQHQATGVRRRQARTNQTRSQPSHSQAPNQLVADVKLILWNLFSKFFPGMQICLGPFKSSYPIAVFIIIAVILTGYFIYLIYPSCLFIVQTASRRLGAEVAKCVF